jgi:hypothetical protein
MLGPVPRDERDAPAVDLAEDRRGRRLAVRRVDLDRLGGLQERIEARATEDPDLGGGQDAFSPLDDAGELAPLDVVASELPDEAPPDEVSEDDPDELAASFFAPSPAAVLGLARLSVA